MSAHPLQFPPKLLLIFYALLDYLLEPFPNLKILKLRLQIIGKALLPISGD
jgi:hypothetical protein